MAKPIQDKIFRSRLTITYRTTITGVPVAEKLPLRLLVLGDFSGRKGEDRGELDDREIRSIKRGVSLDSVMKELAITVPTPETPQSHELVSWVAGAFTGEVKGEVAKSEFKPGEVKVELSGKGEIKRRPSDSAMPDFHGVVELMGEVTATVDPGGTKLTIATQDVPFVVRGRFGGELTGAIDGTFTAKFQGETDENRVLGKIVGEAQGKRTIPIRALDSFGPDQVARNIPEVRRLMLLKSLLQEMQADLTNRSDLRKVMKKLLEDPEAKQHAQELRAWCAAEFPYLALSPAAPSSDA